MSEIRARYSVTSKTTDVVGRTINQARTNHWVIDSPSGPAEAVSTGESFMAGIASCGVSLIDHHAQKNNLPFGTLSATVDAARTDVSWPDFEWIKVHFVFTGITEELAGEYVEVWKKNCPLYRAVVKGAPDSIEVTFEVAVGEKTAIPV